MGRRKILTHARVWRIAALAAGSLALAHCSSSDNFARRVDPRYGVASSPRMVGFGEPVPKGGGTYRLGRPYMVAGRTYVPEDDPNYRAEGLASWYGDDFHGRQTANGEVFDMDGLSAAHPTLPMPSYVRVTNLENRRSLIVRVNDRGPYHRNRVIDVSHKAATLLGFRSSGVARVRVEFVGPAPLEGSDDRMLVATLRQGEPAPAPSMIMLASAKPFVPQLSSTPLIRGDVRVPADRPFTLGQSDSAAVAGRQVSRAQVAKGNAHAVTAALQPRSLDEQARMLRDPAETSVAAYAQEPPPPAAFSTGRGLY